MAKREAKDWYSVKEAAEFLNVSEPTVFRWMKDGTLSFYKVGNSTRFTRETLEAMIDKRTGSREAGQKRLHCAVCGNSELLDGRLQGTGKMYFHLDKTKFWTLSTSQIATQARVCSACGHIQVFADVEKLASLRADANCDHADGA